MSEKMEAKVKKSEKEHHHEHKEKEHHRENKEKEHKEKETPKLKKKKTWSYEDACTDIRFIDDKDELPERHRKKEHEHKAEKPGPDFKQKIKREELDEPKLTSSKGSITVPTLEFTIVPKKGHPWESVATGNYVIACNGQPGRQITLIRGKSYRLRFTGIPGVKSPSQLFFTLDPSGGKDSLTNPAIKGMKPLPVGKEAFIRIDTTFPNRFFYQDTQEKYVGGLVVIDEAH